MNITFGFCFWDIFALILLFAVITFFTIRGKKLKERERELEEELSEKMIN